MKFQSLQLDVEIQANHPYLQSILVKQANEVLHEKYYHRCTKGTLFDVRSITKSVVCTMGGIAFDKGLLTNIDQKIVEIFPDYIPFVKDTKFNQITIRHLLSMTSGIETFIPSFLIAKLKADILKILCESDVVSVLGAVFKYKDMPSQILIYVLEKVVNQNLETFAQENLFQPLKITDYSWKKDANKKLFAGFGIKFSARSLAALGQLYLQKGVFDGKPVVSAWWIEQVTQLQSAGGFPFDAQYGLLWWLAKFGTHTMFFAGGFGGQFIFVVPDLQAVIVITADTKIFRDLPIREMVENFIIPQLEIVH